MSGRIKEIIMVMASLEAGDRQGPDKSASTGGLGLPVQGIQVLMSLAQFGDLDCSFGSSFCCIYVELVPGINLHYVHFANTNLNTKCG